MPAIPQRTSVPTLHRPFSRIHRDVRSSVRNAEVPRLPSDRSANRYPPCGRPGAPRRHNLQVRDGLFSVAHVVRSWSTPLPGSSSGRCAGRVQLLDRRNRSRTDQWSSKSKCVRTAAQSGDRETPPPPSRPKIRTHVKTLGKNKLSRSDVRRFGAANYAAGDWITDRGAPVA